MPSRGKRPRLPAEQKINDAFDDLARCFMRELQARMLACLKLNDVPVRPPKQRQRKSTKMISPEALKRYRRKALRSRIRLRKRR